VAHTQPTADDLRQLIDAARTHLLIAKAALDQGDPAGAKRAVKATRTLLDDPDKP
jgi:hypothetical protein